MDAVPGRVRDSVQALFLRDDAEMGKKDDDHHRGSRPRPAGLVAAAAASLRVQPRKLGKRLLAVLLAAAVVYLFVANLPTDVPVRDHRRPVYRPPPPQGHAQGRPQARPQHEVVQTPPGHKAAAPAAPAAPAAQPAAQPAGDAAAAQTYDGPVRFLELAATLRAISNTRGGFALNKNVLFAAASPQSMAALLPLACAMGAELRSYVHFAVLSRSAIELADLQARNGIDETCNIFFHDARPDYADLSTDARMLRSVEAAMSHIQLYMHPQAVLMDASDAEEAYLQEGLRAHAADSQTALVELPRGAAQRLAWIAKLDSASLSMWNKVRIDVLVQAPAGASGSLLRLLASLSSADYGAAGAGAGAGGTPPHPHLTIELPPHVDPPTAQFLAASLRWPAAQLALRHRIPRHRLSADDSAVRFLESFWPPDPAAAHVLVLSPQAELARDYYSYLKYTLLEHRYSGAAQRQQWDRRLFGISLDLPRTGIDGVAPFTPPGAGGDEDTDADRPFFWQAPNSNALLVLGERWAELHQFVARVLDAQAAAGDRPPPLLATKQAGTRFPAWLEHALRLCRARGLWTLYPGRATAGALATVHRELAQLPEEFGEEDPEAAGGPDGGGPDGGGADGEALAAAAAGATPAALRTRLAPAAELPLVAWDGQAAATVAALDAQAAAYANAFRREVGGCSEGMLAVLLPETLFCGGEE